ncbi:MAG: AmmeMemoRadiSam system radical SAM enzyme [Bacteroidales bacterium]|nr:AmmeMemoRadiSam system radical SAM enzyme [Bacteroidales bacterium]MCF8404977.1 AmmeMemoRadiSam system radical SAM enzyme [Bacteroidales bacterium]
MAAGAVYCGINNKFAGAVAFPSGIQANIHPSGYTSDLKYEARFYTHTPKGIKCLICPSECKIKEGESGECRTRTNSDNILFTKAYGNPCAVHVDPIEKKPLYHFLPSSKTFSIATAGCNLACLNCQNWEISQTSPDKTRNYDLMPEQVVEECIIKGCKSIAYTYSDPVAFYEYTYDTAKIARSKGIKNVLVSAGYINEEPLNEWCQYIDAANIDLKSFSNETYEALNGATLEPVLKTLKILKSRGVWLEITNLVIPNWTDDMGIIKEMCKWLYDNGFENTPLHFSRFHPLYKLTDLYPTPVSTLNMAYTHAKEAGLNYVYIGNVPEISAANTHCPECNKLIVERKGFTVLSKSIENNHCKYCKAEIQGSW